MRVSIIVPVLNESRQLAKTLQPLQSLRSDTCELIVVDGGSHDNTIEIAQPLSDHVIISRRGRALQMNAGAEVAGGDVLLFLHADTQLPVNGIELLNREWPSQKAVFWGRFNVRLSGESLIFRLIEYFINLRSRLTSVATGDQVIFVEAEYFKASEGYPEIPLMEDIALSKRLRTIAPPICIKESVTTSSRRWEQKGIASTVLLMWLLRLLYFMGISPSVLNRMYR